MTPPLDAMIGHELAPALFHRFALRAWLALTRFAPTSGLWLLADGEGKSASILTKIWREEKISWLTLEGQQKFKF